MGTIFEVQVVHKCGMPLKSDLFVEIKEKLDAIENELSLYQTNSLISQLNRKGTVLGASPAFIELLRISKEGHQYTNGAFNIFVLPLQKKLSRQDIGQSVEPLTAQTLAQDMKDLRWSTEHKQHRIQIPRAGAQITLDGIAKGYAVDIVAQQLIELKLTNYLVNFSGNMRWQGVREDGRHWNIQVWNSQKKTTKAMPLVESGAIATSGVEHNFYSEDKKVHPLIDPKNQKSANYFRALSVNGPKAVICDLLSTALFVTPQTEHEAILKTHYPEYKVVQTE